MKHIGHIDWGTTVPVWKTHTLGMLSAHALFIPNPGERENIDAERWQMVGWIDPDKDGGTIFETHAEAGDNSRPAYIEWVEPEDPAPWPPIGEPPEPEMSPTRAELEALKKDLADLAKVVVDLTRQIHIPQPEPLDDLRNAVATLEVKFQTLARIQQHGHLYESEPPMTFYDHAYIACAAADMSINGFTQEKAIRAAKELARTITENRPT